MIPPGQGLPTGAVQFKIDGLNAGPPAPLSNGTAIFTTSTLSHGSHSVAAEYAGDGNLLRCTNALSGGQLINTRPTATAFTIQRGLAGLEEGAKVTLAALLANANDADGDSLTLARLAAISVNGGMVASDGPWIYFTPAPASTNSDAFWYTVQDGWASVTNWVYIELQPEAAAMGPLRITDLGNGLSAICGDGIPGRAYRVEFRDEPASWQALESVIADENGSFSLSDGNAANGRLYRVLAP